jgi:hypothetical protein
VINNVLNLTPNYYKRALQIYYSIVSWYLLTNLQNTYKALKYKPKKSNANKNTSSRTI